VGRIELETDACGKLLAAISWVSGRWFPVIVFECLMIGLIL
jgi:hypothetical protein